MGLYMTCLLYTSPAVWYLNGNIVPCLSLCQGGEAGFAFSLAAHNRIRFPVPGFLAAVYRLVSFTDGFPFAVFSSCFLGAVALSLAPQDFKTVSYTHLVLFLILVMIVISVIEKVNLLK